MKWLLGVLVVIAIGFVVLRVTIQHFSDSAQVIGLVNGDLQACPDSPNCVKSNALHPDQLIDALVVSGLPDETMNQLDTLIQTLPGASVVSRDGNYLHATFKTRLFGFIDDLELLHEIGSQNVQVRSASRIGKSDFGVNRKRVEMLRGLL